MQTLRTNGPFRLDERGVCRVSRTVSYNRRKCRQTSDRLTAKEA